MRRMVRSTATFAEAQWQMRQSCPLSFRITRKLVRFSEGFLAIRSKRLRDTQGELSNCGREVSWQVEQVFVPAVVRRRGAGTARGIVTPTGWWPSRNWWHETQSVWQGRVSRGEIADASAFPWHARQLSTVHEG